jgi:subtilisin family serine protease
MLILALPAFADDAFHPNASADPVSFQALVDAGAVLGRTGHILVDTDDPNALRTVPGVAAVRAHRGGLVEVTPTAGADDLALSRRLHALAGVRWATPDLVLPLKLNAPNDPYFADAWHLENTGQGGRLADVDIDATTAWTWATGSGQTIAIIDSGVEVDHPDLDVIAGHDYLGNDDDPSPNYLDGYGGPHGTCSAGVAAATGDNGVGVTGVAYNAQVYAIRLIGAGSSTSDTYDAFVEAVDAGATVLSNSWGFENDCAGVPRYGVFDKMFRYAEDQGRDGLGALVVFAAGNGGCDIEADGMLEHETAVVVAAVEATDVRAGYSNFGRWVDIAAPTGLLTTDWQRGGYGSYSGEDAYADGFNGTSAAAPVVAGVAALMFEANPRLTAAQARDALCDTAARIDLAHANYDANGWSPYYGCGRIDAGAAVATVANQEPGAPTPSSEALTEVSAVLSWGEADDADLDVVRYEVRWGTPDRADTAPIVAADGVRLDLTGSVALGDTVAWRVRAVDTWGPGPWSDEVVATVEAAPEPPGLFGCAHGPATATWTAAALAVAGIRRSGSAPATRASRRPRGRCTTSAR